MGRRSSFWSDTDRATLQRMIETGSTYRQASEALNRPATCVVEACKRFGIHQPTRPSTEAQIIALCQSPQGMRSREMAHLFDLTVNRVNNVVRILNAQSQLHRAGSPKYPRYFVSAEDAQRYEAAFQQEQAEREKQRRLHKQALKNEARKLARATKPAKEPKPKKEPKRAKALVECARSATKTVAAPSQKPVKVIMPESVKVQVIPTPPSRFHFEPPPGWRGQITQDWLERRQQGQG